MAPKKSTVKKAIEKDDKVKPVRAQEYRNVCGTEYDLSEDNLLIWQ
jgi:hypothetical protein